MEFIVMTRAFPIGAHAARDADATCRPADDVEPAQFL